MKFYTEKETLPLNIRRMANKALQKTQTALGSFRRRLSHNGLLLYHGLLPVFRVCFGLLSAGVIRYHKMEESMSTVWTSTRLKKARINVRSGKYEAIPSTPREEAIKEEYPEIFKFEAISIGDNGGQAFFVPLDESSRETAEYILRAIAAYEGE
jgi:hypothetical protein